MRRKARSYDVSQAIEGCFAREKIDGGYENRYWWSVFYDRLSIYNTCAGSGAKEE